MNKTQRDLTYEINKLMQQQRNCYERWHFLDVRIIYLKKVKQNADFKRAKKRRKTNNKNQ